MFNKKHVFNFWWYLICSQFLSKLVIFRKKNIFWSKIGLLKKIFCTSIKDTVNQNMFKQKILITFNYIFSIWSLVSKSISLTSNQGTCHIQKINCVARTAYSFISCNNVRAGARGWFSLATINMQGKFSWVCPDTSGPAGLVIPLTCDCTSEAGDWCRQFMSVWPRQLAQGKQISINAVNSHMIQFLYMCLTEKKFINRLQLNHMTDVHNYAFIFSVGSV